MKKIFSIVAGIAVLLAVSVFARQSAGVFQAESLKPRDSVLRVSVGEVAPDFSLPSIDGHLVTLSGYRGKKNVMLSFVPAAWAPVCSDQWAGYKPALGLFERYDTQLIGITVDNLPALSAWTEHMGGVGFPVLSDFWPHGAVAERYGVLRLDGTAERALFLIDKQGVIRFIDVYDINLRPDLADIVREMGKLPGK